MSFKDEKTGIIEGDCEGGDLLCEQIPDQGEVYAQLASWQIFFNEKKDRVYIDTTDYHPGYLCLTREALERLLEQFKK